MDIFRSSGQPDFPISDVAAARVIPLLRNQPVCVHRVGWVKDHYYSTILVELLTGSSTAYIPVLLN